MHIYIRTDTPEHYSSIQKKKNLLFAAFILVTVLVSERKIRKAFHLQRIRKNEIPRNKLN